MPTNVKGIERIHEHRKKVEYAHLKAYFRKHNFDLNPFMDTVESEDYKYLKDYLTEVKGYVVEAAANYYHEAYELYDTMVAVDENTYHYVMRTHSHTDHQCLWKVVSRRIHNRQDAENWMDHMQKEELRAHPRSKHEFFIITKEEE
jgi:hypothetical protein